MTCTSQSPASLGLIFPWFDLELDAKEGLLTFLLYETILKPTRRFLSTAPSMNRFWSVVIYLLGQSSRVQTQAVINPESSVDR